MQGDRRESGAIFTSCRETAGFKLPEADVLSVPRAAGRFVLRSDSLQGCMDVAWELPSSWLEPAARGGVLEAIRWFGRRHVLMFVRDTQRQSTSNHTIQFDTTLSTIVENDHNCTKQLLSLCSLCHSTVSALLQAGVH